MALIPVLLAGCGGDRSRLVGPPKFGDPAKIVAWLNVTPVVFHAGESVQIEIGVRNPTKHPIIMVSPDGCAFSYVVKDPSDTIVAPGFLCIAEPLTYKLAPGETIAGHFSWDGTNSSRMPLSPGEYRVHSMGFPYPSTTPVTIQILAP